MKQQQSLQQTKQYNVKTLRWKSSRVYLNIMILTAEDQESSKEDEMSTEDKGQNQASKDEEEEYRQSALLSPSGMGSEPVFGKAECTATWING